MCVCVGGGVGCSSVSRSCSTYSKGEAEPRGWSRDDRLHLAPGQQIKRIKNGGSQEEGGHYEKLQSGLSSSPLASGCKVANEAGG